MTNGYIATLHDRQVTEGWSDERMARELGVSKTMWFYIAAGKREPGLSFVRRAMRRFPEYNLVLMTAMSADGPLGLPRREGSDVESAVG